MARLQPSSLAEMLAVRGVGDTKLSRYGSAFLAALAGTVAEEAAGLAL
jgi:superfamily II DNA helicase RecQ